MPEGPDGKTIIIVKKVSGHGGHHGGAWKVAYADFVTAMMALFLVLWLVNSASTPVREQVASYFRRPGVFEMGSGTPIEIGGAGILPEAFSPPGRIDSRQTDDHKIYDAGPLDEKLKDNTKVSGISSTNEEGKKLAKQQADDFEKIAKEIKEAIDRHKNRTAGLIGDVQVTVDQRGLHLEIMDTPQASMFNLGSALILPDAAEELASIADILKKLPNPIDIEGHTDAAPFKGKGADQYDNWNLSTDRANAARRILMKEGIEPRQIARVVGYADQRLKFKDQPLLQSNRRISISMRFTDQAATALKGTQAIETVSKPVVEKPSPAAKEDSGEKDQGKSEAIGEAAKAGAEPKEKIETVATGTTAGGLKVELTTSQPEGATLLPNKPAAQADEAIRPEWIDKDKIFGDKNPFQVR
jgi:chemotaxis protein MotB